MREENIEAVEAYLNALKQRDLSLAPFAENIAFENPVAGKIEGAENVKALLSGFLTAINDIRIIQHVCEGEFVCTHWEADAVFGIIPIIEKFRVQNGKITEAVSYFDPRPILGS
jgi:limonene-1,2-epoxide hydrolase